MSAKTKLALLDNRPRRRAAQLTQSLRLGVALLGAVYFGYYYWLLHRILLGEAISPEEMVRADGGFQLVEGVQFVIVLLAFLAFALWLYRAYQNVHRLPQTDPAHSESMAGWSWVIPLLNLWYPYLILQEIGHYFSRFTNSAMAHTPRWKALLLSWCILHIGIFILGPVVRSMAKLPVDNLAALHRFALVILLDQALIMASAVVTLAILKTMVPLEHNVAATHAALRATSELSESTTKGIE
ncbi:DUF4328 domain-containing protein [Hymenobacter sp. HDW8]|uniref:DUF4328 domain-containing protein n=1 Tax=Hymenobacter sp. HDW8 TaxID=2714932 RepID=UPI0014074112|nr:DUF4328 domain-containing protein [Hymenobacter sp. HDW8]QIL78368.1 DUF4328 domain-containing protein [Hymenobacter sp. HDW8]